MTRQSIETIKTTETCAQLERGSPDQVRGLRSNADAFELASYSLSFAGLVVLARSLNPIPSRTRPLNSSAPMVLWLKPWESRSLPGLPRTSIASFMCHENEQRRFLMGSGVFLVLAGSPAAFGFPPRLPSDHGAVGPFRVHGRFISKFVRSLRLQLKSPSPKETPMRRLIRPVLAALGIACIAASFAVLPSDHALE